MVGDNDGYHERLPLSPAQALMRAGRLLAGRQPIHNMAWRFDLFLELDPDRFRDAFDRVVAAQEGARLVIEGDRQRVMTGAPGHPAPLDLSDRVDPEAALRDLIEGIVADPVDAADTPWISRLFRLSGGHWVWVLMQDHILTDAASGAVFFESVSSAYQGGPLAPTTPISDLVARRPWEADMTYWRGLDTARTSPPYGGRRDPDDARSRRRCVDFGAERTSALERLAKDPRFAGLGADLTVFQIFATIHAAWLHRATGDHTVSFGSPAHMRRTARDRATLGLFMEQLPFRVEIAAGETFATLHARIRAASLDWLRHAASGVAHPELANGMTNLFNYLPHRFERFAGAPARAEWLHSGYYDANHDLVLTIGRMGGDSFALDARMNAAVFGDHADRMPDHWLTLVDAFIADPDAPIATVDFGGAVLEGGPEAPTAGVLDRFAACVAAHPDAIAVEEDARVLSYAEFDTLVARYAAGYLAAGARAGTPVLVYARRSIETVAAIWGAMRAGLAFVPVSAHTPAARVRHLVEMAGMSVGFLDSFTRGRIDIGEVQPVPATPDLPKVAPEAMAYTIFTSGSTGVPKGVSVDHDGLARYASWAAREHPGDYALHSAIGFDLTITSLVVPLITGRRLRIYPETGEPDLAVLRVFDEDAVDVVKLTPLHLALVLERDRAVSRISRLILGGAALSSDAARRAARMSPSLTVANEYGPTEAVVGAMLHVFDPDRDRGASVSIGRPADGVGIAVTDSEGQPLPPGMPGEIRISGRLARGYLGAPDLTRAKFVGAGPARAYLTGDVGRIEADGRVSYLGRRDDQVKVKGMRIEPAEVETAFLAQPGVRSVHVAVWSPPVYSPDAANCARCGLSVQVPGTVLDADGVCDTCKSFEALKSRADSYFSDPPALRAKIDALHARRQGRYDAIMLLSGGKDSTYALYRLAELTPDILCLTLDNGFISEEAKANIRAVAEELGLDHRMMATPAMPAIFRDSLKRFSNVCQGCFKTIYTLALRVALEERVPAIATGLSRGQFFETRLTPELFANAVPSREEIEAMVLEARKSYHRIDDAVARHLDTADLASPEIFEDVEFLDIYRYIDVPVEEIYRRLSEGAWRRPSDTGRSTNCRINDLGIHVHTTREGYHNYAIPYAWDVRMGHKTRRQALAELRDEIDPEKLAPIMDEIGLDPADIGRRSALAAWVVGEGLDPVALRAELRGRLPREMVPDRIAIVDSLPMSDNGKIDTGALPAPPLASGQSHAPEPPKTDLEARLARIVATVLAHEAVGVTDNFYDIGGDSLAAIRIALEAEEAGIAMDPADLFRHQSIRVLAQAIASREARADRDAADEVPLLELGADDLAALSSLDHD